MVYQIRTDGEVVKAPPINFEVLVSIAKYGLLPYIIGKKISPWIGFLGDLLCLFAILATLFILIKDFVVIFRETKNILRATKNKKSPRPPMIRPPIILFLIPLPFLYFLKPLSKAFLSLLEDCLNFLFTGEWEAYSAIDLILSCGVPEELTAWAVNPSNFIGVHKILQLLNGNLIEALFYIALILSSVIAPAFIWDKIIIEGNE